MKNKVIILSVILFAIFLVAACHKKNSENTIKVGTIAGPETDLLSVAKQVAEKKYHLTIEIISFNDYTMPNMALSEGSIDANVFQHQAYLNESMQQHHFNLSAIGKTFIYPMAIYSKKIKKLSEIHTNAVVTIPNDPTNETRALLLLQAANLIKLKNVSGNDLTPQDLAFNPFNLQIKELDAALLTRTLEDADLAVINTNYAVPAGLLPNKDGLFVESVSSGYANLIVVRSIDAEKPIFKELEEALHSNEVQQAAKEIFHGTAVPAWRQNHVRNKLK